MSYVNSLDCLYAKEAQETARIRYQNAREAFTDMQNPDFDTADYEYEACAWQRAARIAALKARYILNIKERDYDYS